MNTIILHRLLWTVRLLFLIIIICLIMYTCIYQSGLHPKLVYECSLEHAETVCPEISEWVGEGKPWQRVPFDLIPKFYDKPVQDNKCLLAIYQLKIVRLNPYTFHAVKGRFEMIPAESNTIYVYSFDKRYAPKVYEP